MLVPFIVRKQCTKDIQNAYDCISTLLFVCLLSQSENSSTKNIDLSWRSSIEKWNIKAIEENSFPPHKQNMKRKTNRLFSNSNVFFASQHKQKGFVIHFTNKNIGRVFLYNFASYCCCCYNLFTIKLEKVLDVFEMCIIKTFKINCVRP